MTKISQTNNIPLLRRNLNIHKVIIVKTQTTILFIIPQIVKEIVNKHLKSNGISE